MNSLMTFTAAQFAVAGAVCALAPLIIHLLNRRRFRVIHWAAMDFLREAVKRNRRIMQLRDLLLLALRTAAVLLFGLALARPYMSASDQKFDRNQPLHAVLVVDNSLSMGYESLEGSLLDQAKKRATQFIKELPDGSRITIIPLCGSSRDYSLDPYRTNEDALDALNKIEAVDRSAGLAAAAIQAQKACEAAPELSKRIVFLSDQQRANWQGIGSPEALRDYPAMQLVDVSPKDTENTWISSFRLEDGIADTETPATFIIELRHQGANPRRDVQVSLAVGDKGDVVATQTVNLEPGSGEVMVKEVVLKHTFDNQQVDAGRPTYVPVKVSISADEQDRLASDNARYLAVPVVASLPVVFVDQEGSEENPSLSRYGETRQLRRLLVPVTRRGETSRQLVQIRQAKIDELDEDLLSDARLVVIAGVPSPEPAVALLRQYVQQGGQLLIAAGGDFRPELWSELGWLDGQGILPLPLTAELVGSTPEEATGQLSPFFLSYPSMQHHSYFRLAGVSDEELADLYNEAIFFKTATIDDRPEVIQSLLEAEQKRLAEELQFVAEEKHSRDHFAEKEVKGTLDEDDKAQRRANEEHLHEIRPHWVKWSEADDPWESIELPSDPAERDRLLAELARQSIPMVEARFDNGLPFLVHRKIGQGQVILASSSVFSPWNTLPKSNAMLLFDRILRGMLESTLPRRNFTARDQITLPLAAGDTTLSFSLLRPGSDAAPEELFAGYIGANTRGLTISNPLQAGIYQVTARPGTESADPMVGEELVWKRPIAVNLAAGEEGIPSESEMTPVTKEEFEQRAADTPLRWVGREDPISLAGTAIRGQDWWRYLAALVLAVLLVEMAILAWPMLKTREPA